jgi:hypothetical protein
MSALQLNASPSCHASCALLMIARAEVAALQRKCDADVAATAAASDARTARLMSDSTATAELQGDEIYRLKAELAGLRVYHEKVVAALQLHIVKLADKCRPSGLCSNLQMQETVCAAAARLQWPFTRHGPPPQAASFRRRRSEAKSSPDPHREGAPRQCSDVKWPGP